MEQGTGLPEAVGHLKPALHCVQLREFILSAYSPEGQGCGREPLLAQA